MTTATRNGKSPSRQSGKRKPMTRGKGYDLIKELGVAVASNPTLFKLMGVFVFDPAQTRKLLRKLLREGKSLGTNDQFGTAYRGAWAAQDELLSTASARNLIVGLLNGRTRKQIPNAEWEMLEWIVDLIAALRIPTAYSGFATRTAVMQHPTAVGSGFFSLLGTEGNHGTLDSQRVQYIGRIIQAAKNAGKNPIDRLLAAMRAAIEFTLNYFTAPVTASNVKEFSTKKNVDSSDDSLLDQLASREKMKEIYVQHLGGTLRPLPLNNGQTVTELPEESRSRPWQQGLTITTADPYPEAPPSPRRSVVKANGNPLSTGTSVAVSPINTFSMQVFQVAGASVVLSCPQSAMTQDVSVPQVGDDVSDSLFKSGIAEMLRESGTTTADDAASVDARGLDDEVLGRAIRLYNLANNRFTLTGSGQSGRDELQNLQERLNSIPNYSTARQTDDMEEDVTEDSGVEEDVAEDSESVDELAEALFI